MPSIYLGCQISDEISEGVREVRKSLEEARKEVLDELENLQPQLDALSGPKTKASITIGNSTDDNEVKWEAVESGVDGNNIAIFYEYLGPLIDSGGSPQNRPPSSWVSGNNIIHCVLPILKTASIDPAYPMNVLLPIWLSNTDVTDLVTGTLGGAGTGLPEPTSVQFMSGGVGSPLADAETHANAIAKVFGQNNYEGMLEHFDIPMVRNEEEAIQYLESLDQDFIIIGGKLLIVEGTNLQGINALYRAIGNDLDKTIELLAKMQQDGENSLLHFLITENVSTTTYELVCNELQPLVTVTETFRAFDENINSVANRYTGGDLSVLNSYVFWTTSIDPTQANLARAEFFGIPSEYIDEVIGADDESVQSEVTGMAPPSVYIIEDAGLLEKLAFSDDELQELLEKGIDGIRLPSATTPEALQEKLNVMLGTTRTQLTNGLRSNIKPPIAASEALDLTKTFGDKDQTKEMAGRGAGCARQEKFYPTLPSPSIPTPDLPNLPSADLPDVSKNIEGAYAALSSVVNTAVGVFDSAFNAVKKVINPFLSTLQNLNSLANNATNENLIECALGASGKASGLPDFSGALGSAGSALGGSLGGSLGGGSTPSIGGVPVPMDLFIKAVEELSSALNQTITSAFENLMKLLRKPICMAQEMLRSINGENLGQEETNPCSDPKDPDENCPPIDVQDVINESTDLSKLMKDLPQTKDLPTEELGTEVVENIQKFTGSVKKTVFSVKDDVSRGVKQIVEDITKSLETKLDFLDQLDNAIKGVTSDTQATKLNGNSNYSSKQGCTPPSVGFLTDTIFQYL